jgi:predicted nucleic acid-binding Zn ribbon protein
VQRVFAPPIVIFRGSGFYVTDNGRNGLVSRRKDKTASETSQETAKTEKTENNV